MANIKGLIEKVRVQNPATEVEFVVVDKAGNVVCMDISTNARKLVDVLELFGGERC